MTRCGTQKNDFIDVEVLAGEAIEMHIIGRLNKEAIINKINKRSDEGSG
ncbi:hypothetical protein [Ferroplasma acidiphilum]|jgi:hypothetical protein|nr:hypothetical protein [Ferroplasma acidiphilum]WMT53785.1 MAG: hypothetical protein RE473_02800 [Ferroplasma acidiphilum]